MPKKSKQTDPTPLNQLSAMTVDQFCAAHSISRSKFYEFIQLGKGPRCFFVGIQRRISAESATQWRKQMEMEATNGRGPLTQQRADNRCRNVGMREQQIRNLAAAE
jgi:hypothetical protein